MKQEQMSLQDKIVMLKLFYAQVFRYVGLNVIGVLIWMFSGGGYFWPIWVMLLWGLELAYQANQLNLFKDTEKYTQKILSMGEKWKEEQLKTIKANDNQTTPTNTSKQASKPKTTKNVKKQTKSNRK